MDRPPPRLGADVVKVRWDAVVDRSEFWSEPQRPEATPSAPVGECASPVTIQVWPYGALAGVLAERPLTLQFPAGFSVSDVLDELGRRHGEAFRDLVIGSDGRKLRQCRVFVDGLSADDVDAPVQVGPTPALVEIILLTALEGG